MNTSPNSTSKADIKRKLNEKVDYHLFETTSWPADENEVRAFWRTVEEMGLKETVPGTKDTFRVTALGKDCGVTLAACFIGAYEPFEIPMILKEHGLIDDAEEKAFHSFLSEELAGDELLLKYVEVLVRRAHARLYRVKDKLKLQAAELLNDETE
ncbi:hypothetical protein ACFIOY_00250 [Bradyrhizobium sp. TZ2]